MKRERTQMENEGHVARRWVGKWMGGSNDQLYSISITDNW